MIRTDEFVVMIEATVFEFRNVLSSNDFRYVNDYLKLSKTLLAREQCK